MILRKIIRDTFGRFLKGTLEVILGAIPERILEVFSEEILVKFHEIIKKIFFRRMPGEILEECLDEPFKEISEEFKVFFLEGFREK